MEFLDDSKKVIEKHRTLKNLSESEIEAIVSNQKVILNQNCPRCQAANFEQITDYEISMAQNIPFEKRIHSRRCRICGYNAHKNKPLNWKMALRKLWHKEYWEELK
jgi:type I restriction-modification system DNA methylase subunit